MRTYPDDCVHSARCTSRKPVKNHYRYAPVQRFSVPDGNPPSLANFIGYHAAFAAVACESALFLLRDCVIDDSEPAIENRANKITCVEDLADFPYPFEVLAFYPVKRTYLPSAIGGRAVMTDRKQPAATKVAR